MERYILAMDTVVEFLKRTAPDIEESGVAVDMEQSPVSRDKVWVSFFIDGAHVSSLNMEAGPYGENATLSVDSDYFSSWLADAAVDLFWRVFDVEDMAQALMCAPIGKWGLSPNGKHLAVYS